MYSNIGKKIKGLSIFFAWLGVVASCTGGFLMFYQLYEAQGMLIAGLIAAGIIIVGSLLSWVFSWVLYGFGKLIENTTTLNETLNNISENIIKDDYSFHANDNTPEYVETKPQAPVYDKPVSKEIPLEGFKLPETREELFESQLKKLKKDYEMSRITYDEYDSGKKKLIAKYK